MKYSFALRTQNSGQPMIRVVDVYMRRDPTFFAFAEGNPALEACPDDIRNRLKRAPAALGRVPAALEADR